MSTKERPSRLTTTERRHPRAVRRVAWLRRHHLFVGVVAGTLILVVFLLELMAPGFRLGGLYLVPLAFLAVAARERVVAATCLLCMALAIIAVAVRDVFNTANVLLMAYGVLVGAALVMLSYLLDRLAGISDRATRRAQLAEASSDVLSMSSSRAKLDDLLQYAVERIGEQVEAVTGVVLLRRDQEWVGLAGFGQDIDPLAIAYGTADFPAAAAALRDDRVVTIEVLPGESVPLAEVEHEELQRLLMAPMRAFGREIGVIALSRPLALGPYAPEQIRFAESVARYTAIAIENSRLMIELDERRRDLELVRDSSLDFAASLDLAHVLERVAVRLVDALEMDTCDIFSLDQPSGELRLLVSFDQGEFDHSHGAHEHWEIDQWAVPEIAVETRQPVIVATGDDARLNAEERRLWERHRHRIQLDLPLRTRDHVIGVVELFDNHGGRELSTEVIDLAESICRFAALAIDNAQLFDAQRAATEYLDMLTGQLEQLQAVSLEFNRRLKAHPQGMLDVAVRAGTELLSARAGALVTFSAGEINRRALFVDEDWAHDTAPAVRSAVSGDMPDSREAVTDAAGELSALAAEHLEAVYRTTDDRLGGELSRPQVLRGKVLMVPLDYAPFGASAALAFLGSREGYFSPEDELLAITLAAQLGSSLRNALAYQREHEIAETFQTALLAEPPAVPGIDIGVCYRPATDASRVGGDFYDIVPLSVGRVMIAIGDVCGKGLQAAAHTAVVRYMLRAYAADGSPGESLSRLNTTVMTQAPQQPFVTLLVAYIDVNRHMVEFAVAGHPRPIILAGRGEFPMSGDGGLPIGIDKRELYPTNRAVLPESSTLVLYTDGLTEAMRNGKMYGEDRLRKAVGQRLEENAPEMAAALVGAVRNYAGGVLTDDCALVVVKMA